ncbi:hypothetical protein J4E85_004746 [Alternaria conjuncta]|uniref:uncharacterized protein n=1 Tax=Alternaria conjuncta TaxID=181017 RepID=UPI00222004B2|nr:uncharacterized protein J4E85_004746 [Alternaria conjuncta]KAI4930122.1 hypothetical protein J4E85_004746 [Alternaria conjuncta]
MDTTRPAPWPQATNELLPNTLFKLAAQYPSATYAEFPVNPHKIEDGYRQITFAEVANAVSAFAWWLEENIGKLQEEEKDGTRTLVYMGPNDIRYAILCLGSVIAGYKMLFPSPRYGAEALVKLIESVDAKAMLKSEIPIPVVKDVLSMKDMKTLQIPSVEQLLTSKAEPYPYNKTYQQNSREPFVCLHTSGTTGFPKPILWTHEWTNSVAQTMYLTAPPGYELEQELLYGSANGRGMRAMFLFPPFHASGMIGMILFPLQLGVTPIYPPTWMTPAAGVDSALAALDIIAARDGGVGVDCLTLVPPCVEYLSKSPEVLQRLSQRTQQIGWGGGSVSSHASEFVAAQVSVLNVMASTELGVWPSIRRKDANSVQSAYWEYTTLHPALNIRFDPVSASTDGVTLYEAVMHRNDGNEHGGYVQPIFSIFPGAKERRLGDLFTKHPEDPERWKHYGRADDLLVFLTNEKFFPTAAEQRIASHTSVAEVAMVGTRRPKASLIVRLEDGKDLHEIWNTVEEVNKSSPVYARVGKDMILAVKEPFPKTAKGTVQKKALLDLYEKELDVLYGGVSA